MPARRVDILSPVPNAVTNQLSKTPVEYISPHGRRHVALANSSGKSPGTFLSPSVMNDDEAEKRERQLSRVLELQQKSIGTSPATPAERRQSLALGRLTNAQLSEHYADCIKLSTENKISAKNAFGLHLIDYIGELFKKKDVTDFQLASSTIDASAKIYAGRVDAIHSETYKVLTGLGRGANHATRTGDEQDDVEIGEDGDKASEVDKKRKRARKSHTVETNLKNITLTKFDLDFEVDPMFQKTVAAFDEGGTAGLLLNHLRCLDDACELILDCNTVVTSAEDDCSSQTNQSKTVDVGELRDILASTDFEQLEICPQFSQFEFGSWSMEEMSSLASDLEKLKKKDHVFDLEAEPEPIDDPLPPNDGGDIIDDGFGPMEADDDDDEAHDFGHDTVFPAPVEERKQLEATTARLKEGYVSDLISILTSEPSDYSYFRTDLLRTWAGPDHLRLQRRPKDATITAGEKSTKKTKVKEPFVATFDESIDMESHFKLKRAATTITATTLEKHSRMRTTLPEDLHYDDKQLLQLFLMPLIAIKRQQANSQLLEVAQYNYDNANDRCNFCPEADACDIAGGADDDDDDNDVCERLDFNLTSGDYSQQASVSSQGTMAEHSVANDFMGDNLVAPPRKIAKIDIDYAKVAKKVDVKQLKQAMWEILTKQSKEVSKAPDKASTSNQQSTPETGFQEMLNELTKRVSKTMAKNLSVPIAFVCLLHLANEKTLDIRNVGEMMADLNIMLDATSATSK